MTKQPLEGSTIQKIIQGKKYLPIAHAHYGDLVMKQTSTFDLGMQQRCPHDVIMIGNQLSNMFALTTMLQDPFDPKREKVVYNSWSYFYCNESEMYQNNQGIK